MYRRNHWQAWQVAAAAAAVLYLFFDFQPRPHTAAFIAGLSSPSQADEVGE